MTISKKTSAAPNHFGLFELVALICLLIRRRRSQNVIFEQFEADE